MATIDNLTITVEMSPELKAAFDEVNAKLDRLLEPPVCISSVWSATPVAELAATLQIHTDRQGRVCVQ